MPYPLPWAYRRQPPPSAPAPLPAPALAEMEREFQNRPYIGSSYGEAFPMPAAAPQPGIVFDAGLQIEPPPWANGEQAPIAPPPAETVPPEALGLLALRDLKLELGDPVDEPKYKVGPPARDHTPTFGVPIPPWPEEERREEERRRAIARAREQENT